MGMQHAPVLTIVVLVLEDPYVLQLKMAAWLALAWSAHQSQAFDIIMPGLLFWERHREKERETRTRTHTHIQTHTYTQTHTHTHTHLLFKPLDPEILTPPKKIKKPCMLNSLNP